MTAWQYGYLYSIATNPPKDKSTGLYPPFAGPTVYVVVEADGPRRLDDAETLLKAMNTVGAEGWIIGQEGVEAAASKDVTGLVLQATGAAELAHRSVRYFMRRTVDE